ncbi:putative peptidylprolyl isomerase [Helianthus anomalus]
MQCGEKHHVLSCALLPNKTGSLQLDLEFDEAEVVISSIIGIRYVSVMYLTGTMFITMDIQICKMIRVLMLLLLCVIMNPLCFTLDMRVCTPPHHIQ